MFLHGYDHSSLLIYLDPKCLPTKYGGLMDFETDQGLDLWNLLCYYDGNYKGMTKIHVLYILITRNKIDLCIYFSDKRIWLQKEEISEHTIKYETIKLSRLDPCFYVI